MECIDNEDRRCNVDDRIPGFVCFHTLNEVNVKEHKIYDRQILRLTAMRFEVHVYVLLLD